MSPPPVQARILASPPIFFGSWGVSLWLLYQWTLHSGAWPLVVIMGFFLAAVMRADEQIRKYKAWRREWDAASGVVRPKRWPVILGAILGLPITFGLVAVGQQQGASGIFGVLIIVLGPIALIAALAKLWRRYRHRRAERVEPVAVCVRAPIFPVPSPRDAYGGLPDHCLRVMGARA